MAEQSRSGWATASGWVTAFGVLFAGSQLFVMAISTSLEGVQRWPYLTLQYQFVTEGKDQHLEIFVENDGAGPALVKSIRLVRHGTEFTTFKAAVEDYAAAAPAPAAGQAAPAPYVVHRPNAISDQVIGPGSGAFVMLRIDGDRLRPLQESLMNPTETQFEVCYCSSLSISWVGRAASRVAGMPVCWITYRKAVGTGVRPAPGGECPDNNFTN